MFADELICFSGSPVPPFRDWLDAIAYLFRLTGDRVVPVVIDEFPFLVKASSGLPSIIQRELGPGGSGSASRTRLLLCGSAMSVIGGLLSGSAPLRGRARYRIAEPLITFYQAIMSREWARLELGGGSAVWSGARARFELQAGQRPDIRLIGLDQLYA